MLDKVFKSQDVEKEIYKMWEDGGFFTPSIDPKKEPFTIILPLPNANDPMHMGHALFTVEDIMVRYHRMKGEPTLWLPGGDHAGIETQFVFEKHLAKEGKSRFDYDRNTLYKMIWDFAEKNKDVNKDQMKRLGFSMDWSRYHYSLEPEIVERVLATFKKLYDDGLIYRGERIVNFCTRCGTAFSELEVNYIDREDKLYYLDYGPIQIATTRPETIFADVAVAVNPKDKRYKKLIGQRAVIPIINVEVPIIASSEIDIKFGTGGLKVTPGYDPVDFEIGQKNNLPTLVIINRQGRMVKSQRVPEELVGLNIKQAREKSVEMLRSAGKLAKEEPLTHSVGTCYKCGTTIEPMVIPQWFVKTKPLAKPAIEAVKKGITKIVPKKRFEKMYFDWMQNIKDWNISRQIVWGPRIPVWYRVDGNEQRIAVNFIDSSGEQFHATVDQALNGRVTNKKGEKVSFTLEQIKDGLQQMIVPIYEKEENQPEIYIGYESPSDGSWIQETDTFDTWFLSGQWPISTLKSKPGDFEYFYPTSVLDTLWDILFFWVGRMMMFGLYLTGKVPFKTVHIHARVVDKEGRKMSKSKGNVLDPIVMVDKYGADALRMALVMGVAPASDIAISEEKIKGQRNFSNKLWNIARFLLMSLEGKEAPWYEDNLTGLTEDDRKIIQKLNNLVKSATKDIENYRFGSAAENLYQFIWHEFADVYIEASKERIKAGDIVVLSVLRHVLVNCIKLLHPFMPFVTEEIWSKIPGIYEKALIVSKWPSLKD